MEKPLTPSGLERSPAHNFLRAVLRSGLLDRAQLRDALRAVPPERRADPDALADHLVRSGKLSRFQARKLLQGASKGLLLGPYQVLAPIGKGGMSTVYLARDARNQALVALKVLPPKRARAEERMRARFLREMALCKRVNHPHLAWTFEAGIVQGVYYIALEFIPGRSLYRLVSAEGPLTVPRAARLFAEVALGLSHAHAQGLIHRDLKPSNIMVTPNDHAKVLDLGLALVQGELPADRTVVGGQGYVVGTMDYLAPEQAEDASRVDARSDVYGLGCTLYFALTGRPPFPGGTALEKIQRHRTESPVPVSRLNPAVPPGFQALVERMMARRPEQRFASAAEVRQALLPWASGEQALPLDRSADGAYRKAVAALEDQEGSWADLPDALPVALPATAGQRRAFPFLAMLLHPGRSRDQAPWPAAAVVYLLLGLGAGALLALGLLLAGLWHWLHR